MRSSSSGAVRPLQPLDISNIACAQTLVRISLQALRCTQSCGLSLLPNELQHSYSTLPASFRSF